MHIDELGRVEPLAEEREIAHGCVVRLLVDWLEECLVRGALECIAIGNQPGIREIHWVTRERGVINKAQSSR